MTFLFVVFISVFWVVWKKSFVSLQLKMENCLRASLDRKL